MNFNKIYELMKFWASEGEISKAFKEYDIKNLPDMVRSGSAMLDYTVSMMNVYETWDKLSQGKHADIPNVDAAFMDLHTTRANEFFNQFEIFIMPVVSSCLCSWMSGRALEAEDESTAKLFKSHILALYPHLIYLLYSTGQTDKPDRYMIERIAKIKSFEAMITLGKVGVYV